MAGEKSGSDVVLLANTGTVASPTYEIVGSQTGMTRDEERNDIETTHKGVDAHTYIYGKYGSSLTLDKLFVPSGAAISALKTAIRDGLTILVQVNDTDASTTEEAEVLVTSKTEDWPDNDAATLSLDLLVTGTWTTV
jgi:hypothetical protein